MSAIIGAIIVGLALALVLGIAGFCVSVAIQQHDYWKGKGL